LLQGKVVVEHTDLCEARRRIGHYKDGVADGAFSGPEGGATYVHGLLDGSCHTAAFDTLTYHQGRIEGPFAWSFGVHVNNGPEVDPDSRGCRHIQRPTITATGTVGGTFADGIAVDKLVIRSRGTLWSDTVNDLDEKAMEHDLEKATWSEREISIEPGLRVDVPELGSDTKEFAELLGPAHRWAGSPKCPYENDRIVHHNPPL
jgi:hypothetical protein